MAVSKSRGPHQKSETPFEDGRFAEARLEVIEVEHDEAKELVAQAEKALVRINLEKAIQRARSGDLEQYERHVALAESFHDGTQDELFQTTQTQFETLQEKHAVELSWESLDSAAARRERLGTDPGDFTLSAYAGSGAIRLFFGGERPFNLPGLEYEPIARWFVPDWLGDDPDALEEISAGLRSAYPETLHGHVDSISESISQAIAHHIGHRPELAVQHLRTLPIDNPVVAYELGRAACGLGQHDAAVLAFEEAQLHSTEDLVVDGIPVRLFQAAACLWLGDLEATALNLSQTKPETRQAVPHLVAVIAIENGDLEMAQEAIDLIPDEDRERPQLHGALEIRRALQKALDEYPILTDEAGQGTREWNTALEAVFEQLKVKVDAVIADLKTAAGEDDDDTEDD